MLGCLAHGGLGWIYLAKDRNVHDRWVVLKGLLDSGDADAMTAAAAERAYLAEVEHPNIVKIYNFVQHDGDGYIVMEYVGGESVKDILLRQPQPPGEAPAARAGHRLRAGGAAGVRVPARAGPAVLRLQAGQRDPVRGAAAAHRPRRRPCLLDDPDGAIWGTVGYQAPEIADAGPSVSSDLYTVGRALAVLSFPFRGYTRKYAYSLPPGPEVPVFRRFESFHRFLLRATHADPDARFQDAAEMAEQLTGVLREVLAAEDGTPRPAPSGLFGPERFTTRMAGGAGDAHALPPVPPEVAAAALPVPLVDGSDPAAGFVSGLSALELAQVAEAAANAPSRTPEVRLAHARARIELGAGWEADELLDELAAERRGDWRVAWYRAVALPRAAGWTRRSRSSTGCTGCCPARPRPSPRLLPRADGADRRDPPGRDGVAHRPELHQRGVRPGPRASRGGRAGAAVAALDSVPTISIRYVPAQVAAVATAVRGRPPAELSAAELVAAGDRLTALDLDAERRDRLAAEVLEAALDWLLAGPGAAQAGRCSAPRSPRPRCAACWRRRTASWPAAPVTATSAAASSTPPTPYARGRCCDR